MCRFLVVDCVDIHTQSLQVKKYSNFVIYYNY